MNSAYFLVNGLNLFLKITLQKQYSLRKTKIKVTLIFI